MLNRQSPLYYVITRKQLKELLQRALNTQDPQKIPKAVLQLSDALESDAIVEIIISEQC